MQYLVLLFQLMFFNEILCPEDTYIGFVILLPVIIAQQMPKIV